MRWLEVHIDTNHAGLEPVETMLSALGIDGVVSDDEEEVQDLLDGGTRITADAEALALRMPACTARILRVIE